MPLNGYGVLAARVLEGRSERGADTPHYQIRVSGQGAEFRVAVNVLSQQGPSELLFVADEAFQHLRARPGRGARGAHDNGAKARLRLVD